MTKQKRIMEKWIRGRKKKEHEKEKKKLINRLSRIEGQVKGVKKMIDEDIYCDDVLNQISSIKAALNGLSKALLERHLKTCVVEKISNGEEGKSH